MGKTRNKIPIGGWKKLGKRRGLKNKKTGKSSFREDVKKAWESLGFEFEWII